MVTGSGKDVFSAENSTWGVLGDAFVRSAEMNAAVWGVVRTIAGDVTSRRIPLGEFGRVYWEFSKEVGFRWVAGVAAGCVDAYTRAAELKREEMLRLQEMLHEEADVRSDHLRRVG